MLGMIPCAFGHGDVHDYPTVGHLYLSLLGIVAGFGAFCLDLAGLRLLGYVCASTVGLSFL